MTTFSNVLAEAIKYDANGICVYCNNATACATSSIIDFHVSQKYFGTCHIISISDIVKKSVAPQIHLNEIKSPDMQFQCQTTNPLY